MKIRYIYNQIQVTAVLCLIGIMLFAILAFPRPEIYFKLKLDSRIWHNVNELQARVDALENDNPGDPFLMVLGMSAAREAFYPDDLINPRGKVAVLAGSGRLINTLYTFSKLAIDSELKPHSIVLALQSSMLIKEKTDKEKANVNKTLGNKKKFQTILNILYNPIQFKDLLKRKYELQFEKRIALFCIDQIRREYKGIANISFSSDSSKTEKCWGGFERYFGDNKAPESLLKKQLSSYKNNIFKPEAYPTESAEIATLIAMIQDLTTHFADAHFSVIIMPETRIFRDNIPPIANENLINTIKRGFGNRAYQIKDMRNRFEDSVFRDFTHLNESGRAQFSKAVSYLWDDISTHKN